MKEELFTNLPTEIMMDIFLRLPIQSIIVCKNVSKSWRELLESLEFAHSHLSKAAPHLVLFLGMSESLPYKMVELEDERCSTHRCKIVSNFSLPRPGVILGSVNGLLFSCNGLQRSPDIFVCNPITREYIKLPPPPQFKSFHLLTAGVGVSKTSGQYKIVRVLQVFEEHRKLVPCVIQLHTVGTGSWRSFSAGREFKYSLESVGAFLNGNLHWLARDKSRAVTCFDLETELFTSFSSPPRQHAYDKTLSVVGDRLCLCDNGGFATEIWLMNKYGDEKSWTKEIIIREEFGYCVLQGVLFPVKMFINGDILIARKKRSKLLCYSKTTNAFCDTGIHRRDQLRSNEMVASSSVIYTPTFLSLRTLLRVTENVTSF